MLLQTKKLVKLRRKEKKYRLLLPKRDSRQGLIFTYFTFSTLHQQTHFVRRRYG